MGAVLPGGGACWGDTHAPLPVPPQSPRLPAAAASVSGRAASRLRWVSVRAAGLKVRQGMSEPRLGSPGSRTLSWGLGRHGGALQHWGPGALSLPA